MSDRELPPMTPPELIALGQGYFAPRWILLRAGVVAILIAAGMAALFAVAFAAGRTAADPLDRAFERHVEAETKRLCRYEWKLGRATGWPERVMVCGKPKVGA